MVGVEKTHSDRKGVLVKLCGKSLGTLVSKEFGTVNICPSAKLFSVEREHKNNPHLKLSLKITQDYQK